MIQKWSKNPADSEKIAGLKHNNSTEKHGSECIKIPVVYHLKHYFIVDGILHSPGPPASSSRWNRRV
jgi:hypothetical protein